MVQNDAGTTMARPKGRPKKPSGEGTPVRLDSDLVSKARYLAAKEGVPLSEYISRMLRPSLDREFRKAGREFIEGQE
jgi:predicted HicB family RNase H-like nuclease